MGSPAPTTDNVALNGTTISNLLICVKGGFPLKMKIVAQLENGKPTLRVYGYLGSLNTYFLNCAFDGGQNCWVLPYGNLHALMALFSKLPYQYVNNVREDPLSGLGTLKPALREQALSDNYQWKTKPYRHQVEGYYFGLSCPRFLLGDEQGLGKTKQAIDLAVNRRKLYGIRHCLIICGVSALRFNWQSEVSTHSDEGCLILGERTMRNGRVALKGNKEKLADAKRLADGGVSEFFVVTNIESIRDDAVRAELKRACELGEVGMIVFDEFHRAKNPATKQGKAILTLSAPYLMAMTGTPVLNTPLDLYTVLAWLGIERHNFYQFKKFYCYMQGHMVTGYKNQDLLRASLQGHMLRRKKSDELPDLPPKIYTNEYLELEGRQREVYEAIREDIKSNLVDVYTAPNPLAKMVRLRQSTGFPGLVSETVTESVKMQRMLEIVEDCVSNGKKCVVFTNWAQVAIEAARLLFKYNPAQYHGENKNAEEDKARFMGDPECKVLVGTMAKMGVGFTLTVASTCVFLDEPWNQGTKEQCEDRLHRIGTKEPVSVITLICKDTIDERVHDLVYAKGEMAAWLVDGTPRKENVKGLVDYLIS